MMLHRDDVVVVVMQTKWAGEEKLEVEQWNSKTVAAPSGGRE
jgi:hypothetical protein